MTTPFDGELYTEWRRNRLQAILAHYGETFFCGKTLLEVGAATGVLGAAFEQIGATVTSYEGRPENFALLSQHYPHRTTRLIDLDTEPISERFDIILHVGVLYHLKNFQENLINCMACCADLILETEVLNADTDTFAFEDEDPMNPAASLRHASDHRVYRTAPA